MSDQSKYDIRKNIFTTVDEFLSSTRMPAVFVKIEERALQECREVDKRRAEYKRKQYEALTAGCPAEGGDNSDLSLFEFACEDHKCVRKEKRKRNVLEYYVFM